MLKGIPAGNDRKYVADFVIPLDGPATVVSEAWFHRRPTFISHEHDQLEVIEAQLQRVLESQCLVCIPFCNTDTKIGVLVGSIGVDRLLGLRKRSSLLYEYAAQATRTLHTLEKKREVSSRFEALSVAEARQHARQIAHEVNNPLAIIKNYLSVLKNKVVQREFIGDELLILEEEIDRISELVARLARPQSESLDQVTEINQTVNAVMKLFRDSGFVPPSVEILTHTSARLDMVKCPHYILKQILMNLLKNSVEAMPAGGKIEISCKDFINLDGKKYIGLCILDTGPGIRDEIMHTMFIAIKSTKDMKHRGMGLSIVYDLVSQVQGHISCRSNDKGTLFEVLFPLHVPESEVAKNSTQ